MMRKLTTIAAMTAFLGLFAACSSHSPITENDENVENNIAQENQTCYVKVSIHGENGFNTRAAADDGNPGEDDFKNGVGKESEISTIYFVFYDNDGNIVGNIVSAPLATIRNTPSGNTVESIYENTVVVSLLKGQAVPTQVMCYINPISLDDIQKPLSVIETVTRTTVMGADGVFPMSNSVYYPTEDPDSKPIIAASVGKNIYQTLEEAEKATEGVDIYVERRAARLTFKLKNEIYEGTKVKQEYTSAATATHPAYDVAFHIDGWDVNAQAKTTYIVKSFRQRKQQMDLGLTLIHPEDFKYGEKNELINKDGGDWKWNNFNYHRSYWSISPAYFVNKYPEVASDVDNSEDLLYIRPEGYTWKTALDGSAPEYYREATVGRPALIESANPAAAVASVVLKGYYTMNNKAADFFTYQKNKDGKFFIFPKDSEDVPGGGMTMMQRFIELQSVLYKKTGDKYEQITLDDVNDLGEKVLLIQHPEKFVLGADRAVEGSEDLKVASRQQTLQIKTVPTSMTLYYATNSGYKPIEPSNLKDVNLALIHQLGFASFYNKGQAYFNIPIRHLGWYRGANTQKGASKIDWSLVRIGDFGMVRNHVYNIEVESIEGLGTGIGNPKDPIIPPAENKDYYVKYRVNCLKWALVPKQSVNL